MKKRLVFALLAGLASTSAFAQVCQTGIIERTTDPEQFIDNGNGTITDAETGLVWMRCSLGQIATDTGCGGAANSYGWEEGLQAAQGLNTAGGFAGHADWRLPNIKELASIVEYQCHSPAIDLDVFPDTPAGTYWSSTPQPGGAYARSIYFVDGSDLTPEVTSQRYVRLVRPANAR